MTAPPAPTDATAEIVAALRKIAPEMDPARLDRGRPLAAQLDLDSMDYLNFLIALGTRYGIEIPDAELPHLRTVDEISSYLAQRRR